MTQAKR